MSADLRQRLEELADRARDAAFWHPADLIHAETALREALAELDRQAQTRRACSCASPDPVMQVDGKFYCHTCSFETGARPRNLEPEDWMKQARAAEAERSTLAAALERLELKMRNWAGADPHWDKARELRIKWADTLRDLASPGGSELGE